MAHASIDTSNARYGTTEGQPPDDGLDDDGLDEHALDEDGLSDDELTALALAADPDQPLDADAVPLTFDQTGNGLPGWYMPPVMARGASRWRRSVVFALVAAFLLIDAFGLCITYGQLVAA
jgi:hypothetical protein